MKQPLILAWWLCLLTALEVAALILDGVHHLEWGIAGILILKGCYLGFAMVLFLRYLSFRRQRGLENMIESYNRLAHQNLGAEKVRKDSWSNPFWNMVMVVLACMDLVLVLRWNQAIYKSTVLFDLLIWLLALRWTARTYWFKSKGTRERIKEALDDARSKMAAAVAEPESLDKRVSKFPFGLLAGLSAVVSVAIAGARWERSADVFRVDNLKSCMETCMGSAATKFYQKGRLDAELQAIPCVQERRGRVDMSLYLHDGELELRAHENDTSDYFGNGIRGDEGLVLDVSGRFRRSWAARVKDSL